MDTNQQLLMEKFSASRVSRAIRGLRNGLAGSRRPDRIPVGNVNSLGDQQLREGFREGRRKGFLEDMRSEFNPRWWGGAAALSGGIGLAAASNTAEDRRNQASEATELRDNRDLLRGQLEEEVKVHRGLPARYPSQVGVRAEAEALNALDRDRFQLRPSAGNPFRLDR